MDCPRRMPRFGLVPLLKVPTDIKAWYDTQDFASIIQTLGLVKNDRNLTYLYSFYVFFKDNFPDEDYFEGPLFGIENYLFKDKI